jgi:hypothetical protein
VGEAIRIVVDREGGIVTSVESPVERERARPTEPPHPRSRTLITAVAVLASVVLVLGAWVVYDQVTEPAMPGDVQQVIDDYLRAWEERDEAAIRATTDDFVINEYIYREDADTGEIALYEHIVDDIDGVVMRGFNYTWENAQYGQPLVVGDGPWVVTVEENWVYTMQHYDGLAHYIVVDEEGTLKVANHYWAGLLTYVIP